MRKHLIKIFNEIEELDLLEDRREYQAEDLASAYGLDETEAEVLYSMIQHYCNTPASMLAFFEATQVDQQGNTIHVIATDSRFIELSDAWQELCDQMGAVIDVDLPFEVRRYSSVPPGWDE